LNFSLTIRRLGITIVLAFVITLLLAEIDQVFMASFLILWPALFFGWPYLSRRLGFNFPRGPAPRNSRPATPKRPLWLRLVRGTVASIGGFILTILLLSLTVMLPLALSHHRAQKQHNAIRVGMTVPEVLNAVTDCDIFQASSDFPYDDKADADKIPAMSLGRTKDGVYRTYDLATNQNLQLSESGAIARLHAKLHDGSNWTFHYTFINMTPQHISFSVVFGPDGRVTEVKPVYGWD
jgi:hypothetical protein